MPGGFFYWTINRRNPVTPKMIAIPIAGDQKGAPGSHIGASNGNTLVDIQPANPTRTSPTKRSAVCPPGGMRGLARIDEWTINATPLKVPITPMTATSGGGGDGANMCARCIVADAMLEKAKMTQPKV